MQIYSNQSVSCRNIGQVPLRVTQSCEAVYLDQTKPNTMYMDAIFILFLVPLFTKNGAKLTCCMIGGKFFYFTMQKNAFFGFCAEISLFCAEILPCGPPLRPHSCAEPILGVVQNYSFLGDIFTSAMSRTPPRVRADGGYARTGQEIEHVQRLDYDEPVQPNDINVDVREDDEFEFFDVGELMGAGEAEEERMGGQVNREVGAEGGLRIDGEVEGDREQELGVDEVQQQPRRFGRRWANFVRSLLDDARM